MSGAAVHAVELARRRRRATLVRCLSARLDEPLQLPEALADDDARRSLARALRDLGRSGLSGARPYFGLSGPGAFVKRRPRLPGDDDASHEHLRWEAEALLEEDHEDYVVDTLLTARHGFVIAARREILELYGVLCREARMQAPAFDMVPFALCNALEATGAGGVGAELVVHSAEGRTRAVLLTDGDFETETACDDEEAEDALRRLGAATWGDGRAACAWIAGEHGQDAAVRALADTVADLDPFAGLTVSDTARGQLGDDPARARVFAVAAGLAYRGLTDA